MVRYRSTRGNSAGLSFEDVLLSGLAPDGGLYIPESWPQLSVEDLSGYPDRMSYPELALQIIQPFVGSDIEPGILDNILKETYEKEFVHEDVAPLVPLADNLWIMELFHGPTLAFKDFALQVLGRLFDHVLEKKKQRITVVGATSGDTGSAAIEGCRHCKNIDIFILHPKDRVSDIQRKQMTTVDSGNVYNIAVEGTFDDCQNIVKAMFADVSFRDSVQLSAINSINWARILAQIVYYISAQLKIGKPVSFSVPTGNFGNVVAAYAAKQMGFPIKALVIGSNRNDILTRFFETGEMKTETVEPSLSPSMDIQISSNFERYLYNLVDCDTSLLTKYMQCFKETGSFQVEEETYKTLSQDFLAYRSSDQDILSTIKNIYEETGYILDPHTAVGVHAAKQSGLSEKEPVVSLACAHPAKFPEAIEEAIGLTPDLPERVKHIIKKEEKMQNLPNDLRVIQDYVQDNISSFPVSA